MVLADENACEIEVCLKTRLADRLRALQENANRWERQKPADLPQSGNLKERRRVFATVGENVNTDIAIACKPLAKTRSNFTNACRGDNPPNKPLAQPHLAINIAAPQRTNDEENFDDIALSTKPVADKSSSHREQIIDATEERRCCDKTSSTNFVGDLNNNNNHNRTGDDATECSKPRDIQPIRIDVPRIKPQEHASNAAFVLQTLEEQNPRVMPDESHHETKLAYMLPAAKRSGAPPRRRPPTRYQQIANKNDTADGSPPISLDSNFHLATDENKENQEITRNPPAKRPGILISSAVPFQAPIIGREHCGVHLRHVDRALTSTYPEPMLIRALCVGKHVDLRLVRPARGSVSERGAYLLATGKKLIIRNGASANVHERAKVAQLAHEIVAGKELNSTTTRAELANEDGLAEATFWRHLEGLEDSGAMVFDEHLPTIHLKSFAFYQIEGTGETQKLECDSMDASILDTSRMLVLDFGSEIYTWLGRNSNRSLGKYATEFVGKLKSSPLPVEMAKFVGVEESESKRPSWILCRRLGEGVSESLFRNKFSGQPKGPSARKPSTIPLTTNHTATDQPRQSVGVASLSSNLLRRTAPKSTQHVQLKNEEELVRKLAEDFARTEAVENSQVLELEGVEIRPNDPNIHTEHLNFFILSGEELVELESEPEEFDCRRCYVVKWNYRVERAGVRKLPNHGESRQHETGRERGVYFYWLGGCSTPKQASLCALSLRNKDRERLQHIRLQQGREHPVFIDLFGRGTGFLVTGTDTSTFQFQSYDRDGELMAAVETQTSLGRAQTAMAKQVENQLQLARGSLCAEPIWENSKKLAQRLARIRGLELKTVEAEEFEWLRPLYWSSPPRFYRVYDLEGEHLLTNRAHFTFSAQQSDLTDGCIFVENGDHLWIWSEDTVSTFALRVAHNFWTLQREKDAARGATVIRKAAEPMEFKALFSEWAEADSDVQAVAPQSLSTLLDERTRTRTLEEIRERKLPEGCDLKQLEHYLKDDDFENVFKMTRKDFDSLAQWKKIALKKQANLF